MPSSSAASRPTDHCLVKPRASRSMTSACTWTVTCQCTSMSRSSSVRATASCINFIPRTALMTLVTSFIMSKVDYCNIVLACLPKHDLDRVQSVVNADASLSADPRKYDHATPLLMDLHWLWVPERVKFKLCVLMPCCLTGAAPQYLTELAVPVASNACHRLCSTSSADLVVPSTRHSTIGDRAFAVAGPRTWNSLPSDIRTSTSFNTFKKHLKSYLFKLSFLVTMCTLTMYVMRSRSSSCSLLRPINCQIYITLQDCYREIHN